MGKENTKNYGYWLSYVGNVLLWVAILAYFIFVPLYFKNGYERIATRKIQSIMFVSKFVAIFVGGFIVLFITTWGFNKEERKRFKPLLLVDIGMLSFILVAFLSHHFSSFKVVGEKEEDWWFYQGTLWGTSGWYIGLILFLVLVGMYFAISRFFSYTNVVLLPIVSVASLIFMWAILNRYNIYPIEMEYADYSFLASIGNINWTAGFVSVLAPIIFGLYYSEKNEKLKILYMLFSMIADMQILLNGSDSLIIGFGACMLMLLCISFKDPEKLYRFSELWLLFSVIGMLIRILDKMLPGERPYKESLSDLFIGSNMAFVFLALCILLYVYAELACKKKVKYPEWIKKNLSKVLLISVGAVFVFFVLLIIVNTLTDGALPVIGDIDYFLFTPNWGSDRGATWTCGIYTFIDMPFYKKLIGAGPDMFYFQLCESERAAALSYEIFGGARLTNAHNELITLLVNYGVLGVSSFAFMCVSAIKLFIQKSKTNCYAICFALSMITYLFNNVFSFEQVTNVPFFFLVIGLGASLVVKDEQKNR